MNRQARTQINKTSGNDQANSSGGSGLRFDLADFPSAPPAKWKQQGYNRVQIELLLIDTSGVEISDWGHGNSATISIEKAPEGFRLRVVGVGASLSASARWGNVVKVSAYLSK